MQTIVTTEDNVSKYVFEDGVNINITEDCIETPVFKILDLNSSNAAVVDCVTVPADWYGCKYIYDGSSWSLNADFEEQQPIE